MKKVYDNLFLLASLAYIHLNKNVNLFFILSIQISYSNTFEETGENIGQGSGEGAILSAASISDGVEKAFKHSTHEISYGEEQLKP